MAVGGRVFIGVGQDPEHFSGVGHLWCVDLAKAVANGATAADRDVSPELVVRVEKWPGRATRVVTRPNPASALAWHYGGAEPRKWAPRDFKFDRTLSTASVVGDVVYAAELQGFLHCLDARTGKHYWQYDLKGAIWTATYYVDGRVLLATEGGDLFVFRHDPNPEVIDELDVPAADEKGAGRGGWSSGSGWRTST